MRKRTGLFLLIAAATVAAAALFIFIRGPADRAKQRGCYSNLIQIICAKEQAGLELKVQRPNLFTVEQASPISPEQVSAYMRGVPNCPGGGTYSIGYYGEDPKCSLHGAYEWDEMNRAAFAGDVEAMNKAFQDHYGPDGANFMTALPWTPLHSAALGGHADVVSLLIQKGAKINPMTRLGETPLDVATASEVISILRKHGGREVFNVYAKRPHGVTRANALLDVLLQVERPAANTYRFAFTVSNKTDQAVSVKVLSSLVCDIRNGYAKEAEMPSSHADAWLCPPGTLIRLDSHATHRFDLSLTYELEQRAGWSGVRSKATGFWHGSGYAGGTGSGTSDKPAMGVWLLVDIETGVERIMGVPIHSVPVCFAQEM
jgi:hypothetical protein